MNLSIVFILFCFGFFIFLACSFFYILFISDLSENIYFLISSSSWRVYLFQKTSQFALVKVIVNFVLLLLIYFIMNCFEVSDTFPKGRGNKNFVIFVTKSFPDWFVSLFHIHRKFQISRKPNRLWTSEDVLLWGQFLPRTCLKLEQDWRWALC